MKNYILLTLLCFTTLVYGQQKGTIRYEITNHIDPPENMPVSSDFNPKRIAMYDLAFDGQMSLYKKDVEFKDPNQDERRRRWRGANKPHEIYINQKEDEHVEHSNFFRKEFLINDSIPQQSWKVVAGEQRDILGYTVVKAMLVDTSKVVEAWFTPQIPVSVGPELYRGLPGAVLAVTIDQSKVILAKSIDMSLDEVDIYRPTKGKKMSRVDFETLKEEKTAEMKKMWGNSKRRWR